jgi:hypothetical protein
MKAKTALQQSKNHARFLAAILLLILGFLALFPGRGGLVCVGLVAIPLGMEIINIVFIKRKVRNDPGYLEKRIQ